MTLTPSPNGLSDTRDARGRFGRGNAGGPGNPHAAAVARLRAAMVEAVTPEDFAEIARVLVRSAKGGDVAAAHFVCDRLLGRPATPLDVAVSDRRNPADLDEEELIFELEAAGVPLPPGLRDRLDARRRAERGAGGE